MRAQPGPAAGPLRFSARCSLRRGSGIEPCQGRGGANRRGRLLFSPRTLSPMILLALPYQSPRTDFASAAVGLRYARNLKDAKMTDDAAEVHTCRISSERSTCPTCGTALAKIQYGLPIWTLEFREAVERGEIVLGGCTLWRESEMSHRRSWRLEPTVPKTQRPRPRHSESAGRIQSRVGSTQNRAGLRLAPIQAVSLCHGGHIPQKVCQLTDEATTACRRNYRVIVLRSYSNARELRRSHSENSTTTATV